MPPHSKPGVERRFVLSIGLTLAILAIELVGGLWTGSLALLSDAAHIFMDVFALVLSYGALRLSALPADDRHTYGWHRLEVLAALINGATLLVIALGIWREAYLRWQTPQPIRSVEMLVIAVLGLVVNLLVAFVLHGHTGTHEDGHEHPVDEDLNLHSAFLHVVGDAISSVGVIIAAAIIWATGWQWVDPLTSILIGGIILFSGYRVLRASLHILVEGVPNSLSLDQVETSMKAIPEVGGIHDLHVWNICSGHVALSAHVVLKPEGWHKPAGVMTALKETLSSRFGIDHTTIQFEEMGCSEKSCCG